MPRNVGVGVGGDAFPLSIDGRWSTSSGRESVEACEVVPRRGGLGFSNVVVLVVVVVIDPMLSNKGRYAGGTGRGRDTSRG